MTFPDSAPLRFPAILCSFPFFVFGLFAEDALPVKSSDDDLKIQGVFDSNLPNTERKYSLKLVLHPHFGDLHRHDNLRIPVGFRYGLSDVWDVSADLEGYFPHGLGSGTSDSSFGISGFGIGSKYHGRFFRNSEWDQVVGFSYFSPAGSPPADITDGLRHFKPYLNFARPIGSSPNSRVFWGVGLDLVSETSFEGSFQENAIGDSANSFTAGRVWEGERLTYTLESTFSTSRFIGSNERDLVTIRPGIIWKVPRRMTFNSKENWVLGSAIKLSHGHDGFDYGLSVKVRVNFHFKH